MLLEQLRKDVCDANKDLERFNLVLLTWGNVSGIDRETGLMVIKPSGVSYADLKPEQMVVVDRHGTVVEGTLSPSSDTPAHLVLYASFSGIGAVTHTHSIHATAFAQACRPIPCLGTTHSDHFRGEIPVTRAMRKPEIESHYERNTGLLIAEKFNRMDPMEMPAVLVAHHGPFTWGSTPGESVLNSLALEAVAAMALHTLQLAPDVSPAPAMLQDKHFLRKHGKTSTYGQRRHETRS